jgi:hypothetical protein
MICPRCRRRHWKAQPCRPEMKDWPRISACCGAPAEVVSACEGTLYYECVECECPCDVLYLDSPRGLEWVWDFMRQLQLTFSRWVRYYL